MPESMPGIPQNAEIAAMDFPDHRNCTFATAALFMAISAARNAEKVKGLCDPAAVQRTERYAAENYEQYIRLRRGAKHA